MEPPDLYGLPLERFTDERNALAKQLRKEGERDEAARVSKLRKPSVAAWAVNQLVRTQRRDVLKLFKAGDALQKAQSDLLRGGGDPGALRQATDGERAATDQLLERARGLLSSEGHELTVAKLEQVSETLHAAALGEEARAQVAGGCLDRELRHVGLGALVVPTGARATRPAPGRAEARTTRPKPKAGRRPAPKSKPERPPAGKSKPDLTARKPKPDSRAAREAQARAKRAMERAARELKVAQNRRDRAADELRQAEDELAAARQQADDALREHHRVQSA
jgi:hypothetical protein